MKLALAWLLLPSLVSVVGFVRLEDGHWSLTRVGLLFLFVAFNLAALSAPLVLFARWRRVFFCMSPLVFFGGMAMQYYFVAGEYPGQAVIAVLAVESIEQLAGLVGYFWWGLLFPLIWLLAYLCLVSRYVPAMIPVANQSLRQRRGVWLLLGLAGMSNVYAGTWAELATSDELAPYTAKWLGSTDGKNPFLFSDIEYAIFPAQVVKLAFDLYRIKMHGPRYSVPASQFRFQAVTSPATGSAPLKLVLVIGESARPDRWSLFGHARETTPCLRSSLEKSDGRMVAFRDVTAGANLTAVALPMIVGRATPLDLTPMDQERSLLALFREAGYRTFWISNQDRVPYSLDADTAYYGNPDWATNTGRYDRDLLPIVERALREEPRVLVVVHTIGNHWPYELRVPDAERLFSVPGGPVVDVYDDSIRAVDQFLCQLFGLAERDGDPVLVWYVADHGENLPGQHEATKLGQHGYEHPSRGETVVPMLVWANRHFAATRDAMRIFAQRQALPLDQSVVFDTFAGLAQIEFPTYRPEKDLANPAFRISAERWILGGSQKKKHSIAAILKGSDD